MSLMQDPATKLTDDGTEVVLYVQTNNLKDPAPYEMLKMFYKESY